METETEKERKGKKNSLCDVFIVPHFDCYTTFLIFLKYLTSDKANIWLYVFVWAALSYGHQACIIIKYYYTLK